MNVWQKPKIYGGKITLTEKRVDLLTYANMHQHGGEIKGHN